LPLLKFAHQAFGPIEDTAPDNSGDAAGVPNILERVAFTRISRGESPACHINSVCEGWKSSDRGKLRGLPSGEGKKGHAVHTVLSRSAVTPPVLTGVDQLAI
jgi:hypothetical protein